MTSESTPVPPVPVDGGSGATALGLVERVRSEERRPVVPGWARSGAQVREVLRWLVGHYAHTAAYHAVRAPGYAARLAVLAPQGAARTVRELGRWVSDAEGAPARRAAVAGNDLGQYLKLSRQRDTRVQGRALTLLATVPAVVWVLLAVPGPVRLALLALTVGLLGALGAPADRPLVEHAVVVSRYSRLTGDIVMRAFESAGLCKLPDNPITFPQQIALDGEGWRAVVDLPYGRTFTQAMGKRENIASGLDASEQQVFLTSAAESARRVVMWVAHVDPLSVSPGRTPLLKVGQVDCWKPIPFGLDERGNPVTVSMLWTSLLVGAVPRQGKTFSARLIALAAALDPHVRLYVYDGKGSSDWRGFARIAHRCGFGLRLLRDGTDPAALLLADLTELKAEVEARYERLSELPTHLVPEGKLTPELARNPSLGMPLVLVVLDEVQEYLTHPEHGKAILELATYLVRVAPAVGVSVLSATQKPENTSVPSLFRDQHQARFCLRVTSWNVSDVVLGAGAYSEGLDASRLLPSHKGVGLLRGMGDIGLTVRTYLADQDDADSILARARVLREQTGTLTGVALGDTPDPAPAFNLLDDVLTVVPATETKVWSETVVERLADLRPEFYGGWTPDQLAAALKPHHVTTKQVWGTTRDGRGANRRGIERPAIVTARDRPPRPGSRPS